MGGYARATTGTTGCRLMSGFDINNLKTSSRCEEGKPENWTRPKKIKQSTLGFLIGDKIFDQLVMYILRVDCYPLTTKVSYGNNTQRKFILVGNTEYWLRRNEIHKRVSR